MNVSSNEYGTRPKNNFIRLSTAHNSFELTAQLIRWPIDENVMADDLTFVRCVWGVADIGGSISF